MSIVITFTFLGTVIWHGEKFKMPLTPAFTSASAVCWAASRGTAIIARLIFRFFNSRSFEASSIVRFSILLPTFLGSLSKAAAMLKSYITKPGYAKTARPRLPTPTKAAFFIISSLRIFLTCLTSLSFVLLQIKASDLSDKQAAAG